MVVAALTDYVDNREFALSIWIAIAISACLFSSSVRPSVLAVFRTLFLSVLAAYLLALVANTLGLVWIAAELGLWDKGQTGEVLLWFFGAAFVTFINLGRDVRRTGLARRLSVESVGAAVFLDFFVNLHPFSVGAELILIPVVVFVVALATVAATNPEHAIVALWMNRFLTILGLIVILYVVQWLIFDFKSIDWESVSKTLVAPIWLTLGSIPIFCTFRWFVAFGELSGDVRMEAWRVVQSGVEDASPHKMRAKVAVLRRSKFRIEPMLDWHTNRQALRPLVLAQSFAEADAIVREELGRRSGSVTDHG